MSPPRGIAHRALGIALLATGLLIAATMAIAQQRLPFWAAAAAAAGFVLWILIAIAAPPPKEEPPPITREWKIPRTPALAAAGVLAIVAWMNTGGNVFRAWGLIAWVGSVAAWLAAWWPDHDPGAPLSPERPRRTRWLVAAAFGAISVCAIFFYTHRLASVPGNPTSDHAETLIDVTDLLRGERPIFFERNTGREPWKFYSLFVLVRVFGLPAKYLTVKIATAIIGLLAIPAMFLLGREIGGTALGLFASALVAWSQWPVGMARLGNRFSYGVFPAALALWALLRYLRKGDRASVLWAGVWIGIGFYGYIPARAVPLMVLVALALALADGRRRGQRSRLVLDGLLIADTALLVFLPLCHYMVEKPENFWMRAFSRTGQLSGTSGIAVFVDNLRRMALAFHWRGDAGFVNAIHDEPFLEPVTGVLLLAGTILAAVSVARKSLRWGLPLAGLFVLTLPSTFNLAFPGENPSINRSVAAIPVVFLLAALPLAYLASLSRREAGAFRWLGFVGIAVLLAFSLERSYVAYFVRYNRHYHEYVIHPVEMARTIESYAALGIPTRNAYVVNSEGWLDPRSIGFELGEPAWAATHEVPPGRPLPALSQRPLLFLFKPDDAARREALSRLYPDGELRVLERELPDRSHAVYVVR